MTTARTLQPEDHIAHYRVVGAIGSGGMGEVYLAQDQTLERNVALKVLPQELTRSEERVRRFVQEAKSASSLNHPNIITIYEIGQDTVKSASGEPSSGSVQYISMELVSGKTLGAKIHDEKTDLRSLLGYLAQAAEGIAKAHAAGIVHRDLKPGNIMVSDDGFAKVLDFGLAKLTEKRGGEASATAMTVVGEETAEGAVIGTVHYMSPEQVQGKSVDHRSDVFSFGCILYEAATRQRPFVAESNVETMHKILHEKPLPIEEVNPAVPSELRRLIRRCMNKSADQRLQSMKDVALELREIVDEFDALSVSATSATTGSGSVPPVAARRGKRVPLVAVIAAGAVVVAAALFFGLRGRQQPEDASHFTSMRISTVTSRGNVRDCVLSPDGRYLAYLVSEAGTFGMYVRQVATGTDIEVIPMSDRIIELPVFSPDGNYLFYLARKPDKPLYRSLYRMPSLGGPSEERAFDVDSRVTFSPDGEQFAFTRGVPQEARTAILIMPAGGGGERELANITAPEGVQSNVEWSPDGKSLTIVTISAPPVFKSVVAMFDVATGKRSDLLTRKNAFYNGVTWLGDGTGLILTGQDLALGFTSQAVFVSYPGGRVRRITNDFMRYEKPSVDTNGSMLSLLRGSFISNLWSVDPGSGRNIQLTRATSAENAPWRFRAGEDAVFYGMPREGTVRMFSVPRDGGEPRLYSTGPGHVLEIRTAGDVVAFETFDADEGKKIIWCMQKDGSNLRRLTDFPSEDIRSLSPDGTLLTFTVADSSMGMWIVPTAGGEPRMLAPKAQKTDAVFSRDGTRVLIVELDTSGGLVRRAYRAYPVDGNGAPQTASVPPTALDVEWLADGSGVCYQDRNDPMFNIFRVSFSGGEPVQVTHFTDARVSGYALSPDGKSILLTRRVGDDGNVWVCDSNGGQLKKVTNFVGQTIFEARWAPDSRRMIVSAGTAAMDVVLIRDFR